ncbi:MAG TPA: ABC transporter substrate-binding protein [Chloroflexota bacterium]
MQRGRMARACLGLAAVLASVGCQAPAGGTTAPAASKPAAGASAAGQPAAGAAPAASQAPTGAAAASQAAGGTPAASQAAAAPTAAPAPATLHYSIAARTAPLWQIFVTVNKGFFTAEGIDADVQVIPIATASLALVSGSLDVAGMPIDTLVLTQGAGDVVGIGSETETPIYSLIGGVGVSAPADLRDKAIAASGPTSGNTAVLKKIMSGIGIGPTEYQVLNVGGTPDRYAALHSGQVGAALLTQPFDIQAASEGFKTLARSPDYVPNSQYTLYNVRRPWLAENRAVAVRFLRAVMRGVRWLYDPANRADAERILMTETGADAPTAAQLYELYLREVKIYQPDAEPLLSHLQGNIDLLLDVQAIEPPAPSPEQFLDLGPLKEAQASLGPP